MPHIFMDLYLYPYYSEIVTSCNSSQSFKLNIQFKVSYLLGNAFSLKIKFFLI